MDERGAIPPAAGAAIDAGARPGDLVLTGPAAQAAADLERLCDDPRPEFRAGVDDAMDQVVGERGAGPSRAAIDEWLATLEGRGLDYVEGALGVLAITNRLIRETKAERAVIHRVP